MCPQIIELLQAKGMKSDYFVRAATLIATRMLKKEPKLTTNYLFNEIVRPLKVFDSK